jgi:hypothetical protein
MQSTTWPHRISVRLGLRAIRQGRQAATSEKPDDPTARGGAHWTRPDAVSLDTTSNLRAGLGALRLALDPDRERGNVCLRLNQPTPGSGAASLNDNAELRRSCPQPPAGWRGRRSRNRRVLLLASATDRRLRYRPTTASTAHNARAYRCVGHRPRGGCLRLRARRCGFRSVQGPRAGSLSKCLPAGVSGLAFERRASRGAPPRCGSKEEHTRTGSRSAHRGPTHPDLGGRPCL